MGRLMTLAAFAVLAMYATSVTAQNGTLPQNKTYPITYLTIAIVGTWAPPATSTTQLPLLLDSSYLDTTSNLFATGARVYELSLNEVRADGLFGWQTRNSSGDIIGTVIPVLKLFNLGTNATISAERTTLIKTAIPRGDYGNITAIFLMLSSDPGVFALANIAVGVSQGLPDGPCIIFSALVADQARFVNPAKDEPRYKNLFGTLQTNQAIMVTTAGVWQSHFDKTLGRKQTFAFVSRVGSGSTPDMISSVTTAGLQLVGDFRWPAGVTDDQLQVIVDALVELNPDCLVINALSTEPAIAKRLWALIKNRNWRTTTSMPGPTLNALGNADGTYSSDYTDVTNAAHWDANLRGRSYNAQGAIGRVEVFKGDQATGLHSPKVFETRLMIVYPNMRKLDHPSCALGAIPMAFLHKGHEIGCTTLPCPASAIREGIKKLDNPSAFGRLKVDEMSQQISTYPFVMQQVTGKFTLAYIAPVENLPDPIAGIFPARGWEKLGESVRFTTSALASVLAVVVAAAGSTGVTSVAEWIVTAKAKNAKNYRSTANRYPTLFLVAAMAAVTTCSSSLIMTCSIDFIDLTEDQSPIGYNVLLIFGALLLSIGFMLVAFRIVTALPMIDGEGADTASTTGPRVYVPDHNIDVAGAPGRAGRGKSIIQISFGEEAEGSKSCSRSPRWLLKCGRLPSFDIRLIAASVPFALGIILPQLLVWYSIRTSVVGTLGSSYAGAVFVCWVSSITMMYILFSRISTTRILWGLLVFPTAVYGTIYTSIYSATYTRDITASPAGGSFNLTAETVTLIAGALFSVVLIVSLLVSLTIANATKGMVQHLLNQKEETIRKKDSDMQAMKAHHEAILLVQSTETDKSEILRKYQEDINQRMFVAGWLPLAECPLVAESPSVATKQSTTGPKRYKLPGARVPVKARDLLTSPLALHFAMACALRGDRVDDIMFLPIVNNFRRLCKDASPKTRNYINWVARDFLHDAPPSGSPPVQFSNTLHPQYSEYSLNHDSRSEVITQLEAGKIRPDMLDKLFASVCTSVEFNVIGGMGGDTSQAQYAMLLDLMATDQKMAADCKARIAEAEADRDRKLAAQPTVLRQRAKLSTPGSGGVIETMSLVPNATAAAAAAQKHSPLVYSPDVKTID